MELHIALIQYIMMYGKNVLKFFSRITDVQFLKQYAHIVYLPIVYIQVFIQIMVFGVMMGL